MLTAGNSSTIPFTVGAAGTECTVTIGALNGGHIANPNTIKFTAQSGTTPPPPPPPPVDPLPGNCPAIPTTSVAGDTAINDFSAYKFMRMASGAVGYYPVPASPNGIAVVEFSQVADSTTPGSVITDIQVSLCPGSWDPPGHAIADNCKMRSPFANLNNMKVWNAAAGNYNSQAALDASGASSNCWAPKTSGQYYVNIRWTFPSCPFGASACGFTHRWNQLGSNSPF